VYAYELTNRVGTRLTAITLGATITSLRVADRTGTLDDVVLGMDDVDGYLTRSPYFGTVVGLRNHAGGRFALDGVAHELATNDGPNHLHGGTIGFDKQLYAARAASTAHGVGVRFSLTSPDGDEGYPGEVRFSVRYLLHDDNRVFIDSRRNYAGDTVQSVLHTYWNLLAARADIWGTNCSSTPIASRRSTRLSSPPMSWHWSGSSR
jgi:aldose 1-epimerase